MRQNTHVSKVGPNRPVHLWDVYLQERDTLDSFTESFDKWHSDQGSPRFFRVTVYAHNGDLLVNQTTIEGMQEFEIFKNALLIGRVLAKLNARS